MCRFDGKGSVKSFVVEVKEKKENYKSNFDARKVLGKLLVGRNQQPYCTHMYVFEFIDFFNNTPFIALGITFNK